MQRQAQPEIRPTRQKRRAQRPLLSVLGLAALCWCVGCTSTNNPPPSIKNDDPLIGGFHQQTMGPTPPTTTPIPNKAKSTGMVVPLPAATETGSLTASAINQPGLTSRTLAIDEKKEITQPLGNWQKPSWNVNDKDWQGGPVNNPPTSPIGVSLGRPEKGSPTVQPLPSVGALPEASGTPTTSYASPMVGDLDTLLARLKNGRVVHHYNLETYLDGFKFTCQVQNPASPNFQLTYVATARDERMAVVKVLEQLEKQP